MYKVHCDFCDQPATTIDYQHLCEKHARIREMIRKAKRIITGRYR